MGCRKLSYYQEGDLGKNHFFSGVSSEKRATELFFGLDYYPYGKILREYIATNNTEPEKYLTTHHERDTETGLDYRGARYYDADVARFLSLDPLAAVYVSLSDYVYVAGNPLIFVDEDGKVITDAMGNKVAVNVTKNDNGTYNATYKFSEGTEQSIKDKFMTNGARVINSLIQIESGREIVNKADNSADNIHINVSPDTRISEEKLPGGATKKNSVFGSTKYGTIRNNETKTAVRVFEVTIYEGTINAVSNDNTNQSENKQLYLIDKLTQDQKVASTGAHELDHATKPEQVALIKKAKSVTEKQHEETRDFQKKVSGEFGEQNKK